MRILKVILGRNMTKLTTNFASSKTVTTASATVIRSKPVSGGTSTITQQTKIGAENTNEGILTFLQKNKFLLFAVTVLLTNFLLSFKPEHLKRPEVLARNRLAAK